MKIQLAIYFATATLVGSTVTLNTLDSEYNYIETVGLTSSIKTTCYIEALGEIGTEDSIDTMPCDKANRLVNSDADYGSKQVQSVTTVKFHYESPADNSKHSGTLEYRYGESFEMMRGGRLKIMAHKSDPKKVQKL